MTDARQNTDARTQRQVEMPLAAGLTSAELKSEINHQDEFYRLLCVVVTRARLVFTEASAKNLGLRLQAWTTAVVLPQSGIGDLAAVAATLNVTEDGARKHIERNKVPSLGGTRKFYNLGELSISVKGGAE